MPSQVPSPARPKETPRRNDRPKEKKIDTSAIILRQPTVPGPHLSTQVQNILCGFLENLSAFYEWSIKLKGLSKEYLFGSDALPIPTVKKYFSLEKQLTKSQFTLVSLFYLYMCVISTEYFTETTHYFFFFCNLT